MVDLCGAEYIIDYCISTFKERNKQKVTICYIAECLRAISENTCHAYGVTKGNYMEVKYIDLINGDFKSQSKKTGEEIVNEVIINSGLEVTE